MEISKVKLVKKGQKGLEVTYLKPETDKQGRTFNNEYSVSRKHPIHIDLEDAIQELKAFGLEIYGYLPKSLKKEDRAQILLETTVTSVTFSEDSFHIVMEREAFDTKTMPLPGVNVQDSDGYENFDKVMDVISNIVAETILYMENKKKVSDDEVVIRYIENTKNADIDLEAFKSMSAEEKKDLATKILEKMGCIVLDSGNVDVKDVDLSNEIAAAEKNEEIAELPAA